VIRQGSTSNCVIDGVISEGEFASDHACEAHFIGDFLYGLCSSGRISYGNAPIPFPRG